MTDPNGVVLWQGFFDIFRSGFILGLAAGLIKSIFFQSSNTSA